MRVKRMTAVFAVLAIIAGLIGFMAWTAVSVQAQPVTTDLELISEETGYLAAKTPLSADCFFDDGYQVYLCEHPTPAKRPQTTPQARANALSLLTGGGALFIIDSTAKRLMVFDPHNGNLVDPAFIELDAEATGTAIHAIVSANNSILISDQTRDVVHEYSFSGAYLGVFAPAGGANTAILDNIRGMSLRPNGNLLVTVATGANANAIAEFDPAGSYVGNFVANGSGELNSPYDVYGRPQSDWLVSSINNNRIISYNWANGAFLGQFAALSSFPQQIYDIANGNVLVSNFSGTVGVHEFTAAGAPVGVYAPPGISSYRGVYELGNGNILASTSGGVYEINRAGNLVATKYTGGVRFIELVQTLPSLELVKTVGLDSSECAATDSISVAPGTAVTYCFFITNSTGITLTRHDLMDSHLGVVLNGLNFSLIPGGMAFITQTAVITQTTINTATWTAYNPGPTDLFSSTDIATVNVLTPAISLSVTVGDDPSVCATTSSITAPIGSTVFYCYLVQNNGGLPFNQHTVTDSELGPIAAFPFTLNPGASAFFTNTHTVMADVVSTVTWLAEGNAYSASAQDTVSVIALRELYLPIILQP